MIQKPFMLLFFLIWAVAQGYSQGGEPLKRNIEDILRDKNATVGVAIQGHEPKDTLTINGSRHFPMQSVFKFPTALTVLSEIDKGTWSLDQKIHIKKSELLPGLWSPIREKYPEGGLLTLREILEYTVAQSDNVGCDVLLRLLGKPQVVETYFNHLGFGDFSVKINEETMQHHWNMQFLNWTTPREANRILERFYKNEDGLLSQDSHDLIWTIMKATRTGKHRLRGQLPKETVVAHKTGWSGKHRETGMTAAVNDMGIVFLPNGKHLTISVFVTESMEDLETNENLIAAIAKAAWDHFMDL